MLDEQIASIGAEIEDRIHEMDEEDETDSEQIQEAVELLDTIPGVDKTIAEVIVAELGIDMSRFRTAKHAASWAGLSPGNNESAGKHRSGRTKKGNRSLRSGLVQAKTKDTYLSAQYRRLIGRRGKKRALVAVAHSILVMAYHILKWRQPYRELGANYFDERKKESVTQHLTKRLEGLGYSVSLEPKAA